MFQQKARWWPGDRLDVAHATGLFLDDFTSKAHQHTGRPVEDCWHTQLWAAPDPRLDPEGFAAAPETMNYTRRVPAVQGIIDTGRLPG